MKMKKSAWIVVSVAVVAAGALGARTWRAGQRKAERFEPVEVTRGDIRVNILTTGTVQPRNRLELKPPIAGRVEEVLVREGQTVKRGQILAWLSSTDRAALIDAARAKGAEALSRWEELYKPTPLVAPLNGTVISRNVEPGQTVSAQDAALVMSDRLIVKAQVDETDIGNVKVGQSAAISLDAYPADEVPARVEHIAFEATTVNNVTVYQVDILPAHVPSFMRSGMTANVTFQVAEKKGVLVLPSDTIQREDGRSLVRVRDESKKGRPDFKEIEVGLTDGKQVEVVSGLAEGDQVLGTVFRLPSSPNGGSNPFLPFGGRRSGSGGSGGGQGQGQGSRSGR